MSATAVAKPTYSQSRVLARQAAATTVMRLARGEAVNEAICHVNEGRLADAEAIVRRRLQIAPNDVAALCLLGDLAARSGVHGAAERLFRLALAELPHFTEAQVNLARILALRDAVPEAIGILDELVVDMPESEGPALLRLSLLGQLGAYDQAVLDYRDQIANHPDRPATWLAYGHLMSTVGDISASIAAYRRAIELAPELADGWWSLANLKTYIFAQTEIDRMQRHLAHSATSPPTAALLHFALGKAFEDKGDIERAFGHYAEGNRLRRLDNDYDPRATSEEVDRAISFFTPAFFTEYRGVGHDSSEPIFIVGMPRSGSTLLEQILASHSKIEGTAELPYIPMLVHRLLSEHWTDRRLTFPEVLRRVPVARFQELGQTYLAAAAAHRREGRPFFIDKLPNNWLYVGLIHLILPNAKIIDAKREPMACCWSNFRQNFARGQEFSYALEDIGLYYKDYERFLAHVDNALPLKVHRVQHERLLMNPKEEIREVLSFIGLDIEASCLSFNKNRRPVRTASAQQVRRPLQQKGAEQWQKFAPWIGPLQKALN